MRGKNSIQAFNKKALLDIARSLEKLPKEFSTTKKRNVLKKGIDPFINAAILKAPKKTGDLKLSIGTKTFRGNKNFLFGGVITKKKIKIGGSVGSEELDAFYAKFIEYGYTHIAWPEKGRRIKGTGYTQRRLSEIPARPFLRPAWDQAKARVQKETEKTVEKRVKSYLKKVRKIR